MSALRELRMCDMGGRFSGSHSIQLGGGSEGVRSEGCRREEERGRV